MILRRSTVIWIASLVCCFIFGIWGWIKYVGTTIDVTLCANWAHSLVQATDLTIKESDSTKVANELAFVSNYYRPSSEFLKAHSMSAYSLMEQVRAQCIQKLIQRIKDITKDNLSNHDPTPWIMKYASENFRESHQRRIATDTAEQGAAANP